MVIVSVFVLVVVSINKSILNSFGLSVDIGLSLNIGLSCSAFQVTLWSLSYDG